MKTKRFYALAIVLYSFGTPVFGDVPTRHQLSVEIIEYLQGLAERGFGGAVLIARGDEEPLAYGFGWANREERIPWTPETVFTVGSITKQFTATAILKLHEEGKLSLEDTLPQWFDDVPEDKSHIRIHHLLTHTAGIRAGFGGDFNRIATRAWLLDRVLQAPLLWGERELGKRYEYSNAGYSLLAMIVENASGTPYEQFMWERFFEPLGMTDTGYSIPDWNAERFAHGYQNGRDWGVVAEKHPLPDGPNWNLRGNGGIHSTMRDLRTWHRALIGDRVLNPESRKLMETPHIGGRARGYGYGWGIETTHRETTVIAHSGGNNVFAANFIRYDDEETLVLFATNTVSDLDTDPIVQELVQRVFPSNE